MEENQVQQDVVAHGRYDARTKETSGPAVLRLAQSAPVYSVHVARPVPSAHDLTVLHTICGVMHNVSVLLVGLHILNSPVPYVSRSETG